MWLLVILGLSLLLTSVAFCHFMCQSNTYWGGLPSSQVSHCLLLGWLHCVPGVKLLIFLLALCHPGVLLLLSEVVSQNYRFFFHSLWWLCIILGVPQLLSGVASCCPRFCTAHIWGPLRLFLVSHCHSLGWLCVISGFPLLLTWMVLHGSGCPTASHWCDFASSHVS